MKISYKDCQPYKTKDNSEIRELLHPDNNIGVENQSLAEARVATGDRTCRHLHKMTQEIYFILKGNGQMFLGSSSFAVEEGDSILIPANTAHCIENTGTCTLVFLCCCSPAYQHDDTYLITDN